MPFDESIQPGDGTWGFSLATEAYRELYWHTSTYFTGSWLFSPQDTTGVITGRGAPGEGVVSATDQYLWRGGFSRPITGVKPLRGLALSIGGRMEGVPVRDAFRIKQRIPQAWLCHLHRTRNDVFARTLWLLCQRSVGDGA